MNTSYEEIVQEENIAKRADYATSEIALLANNENIKKSHEDTKKRLLLCIDVQNDFIEGGALAVPGSIEDVKRITRFIYNNMENITKIACSMDTHVPYQIFHPCFWKNSEGKNPEPYTIITYESVLNDEWIPNEPKEDALEYLKEISNNGQNVLCIWPYHCIEGTPGRCLENEFDKMVLFHGLARNESNVILPKGNNPYSEMYGIIRPEYTKDNYINQDVLDLIKEYDEVYVVGEASSHCVLESVRQVCEQFKDDRNTLENIYVLMDCMSPIVGYEEKTVESYEDLSKKYGIKLTKSTEVVF